MAGRFNRTSAHLAATPLSMGVQTANRERCLRACSGFPPAAAYRRVGGCCLALGGCPLTDLHCCIAGVGWSFRRVTRWPDWRHWQRHGAPLAHTTDASKPSHSLGSYLSAGAKCLA